MKATTEHIQDAFHRYNELCFNSALKPLPISFSNARTYLAQLKYRATPSPKGQKHFSDFKLVVSRQIESLDNDAANDVIIHEMIHYFVLSQQMQDTSPHGKLFRAMMHLINKRNNRHITISHRFTPAEQQRNTLTKVHIIGICTLNKTFTKTLTAEQRNCIGVAIIVQSHLHHLWNEIEKMPEVDSCQWYISTNPYFNRFTHSKKPKVYLLPNNEITPILQQAKRLYRYGNTITAERR